MTSSAQDSISESGSLMRIRLAPLIRASLSEPLVLKPYHVWKDSRRFSNDKSRHHSKKSICSLKSMLEENEADEVDSVEDMSRNVETDGLMSDGELNIENRKEGH